MLGLADQVALRQLGEALHRRDQADGFLPAVNYGPPMGLLDAAVWAVANGTVLPDLYQLPDTVRVCMEVAHFLCQDSDPVRFRAWLAQNRRDAEYRQWPEGLAGLKGVYSVSDYENLALVGALDSSTELAALAM